MNEEIEEELKKLENNKDPTEKMIKHRDYHLLSSLTELGHNWMPRRKDEMETMWDWHKRKHWFQIYALLGIVMRQQGQPAEPKSQVSRKNDDDNICGLT